MNLIEQLKAARDAHVAAQEVLECATKAIARYESLLAELDADIARQDAYLKARKLPVDQDMPLLSLRTRRSNLVHSLTTLRTHLPDAEKVFNERTEQLADLVALIKSTEDEAVSGENVAG